MYHSTSNCSTGRMLRCNPSPSALIRAARKKRSHSLTLELSALRRNHAGRRAALGRATLPPISASCQPVRGMIPHLQPRISHVLPRALRFSVSDSSECNMVGCSTLPYVLARDHSLCDPLLKPKRSDCNRNLANDQDGPFGYKSHNPPGRLPSSRCI